MVDKPLCLFCGSTYKLEKHRAEFTDYEGKPAVLDYHDCQFCRDSYARECREAAREAEKLLP